MKAEKARRWYAENAEAIEQRARRIEEHGMVLAEYAVGSPDAAAAPTAAGASSRHAVGCASDLGPVRRRWCRGSRRDGIASEPVLVLDGRRMVLGVRCTVPVAASGRGYS